MVFVALGFSCVYNSEKPEIARNSSIHDIQNYIDENFHFPGLEKTGLLWSSVDLKDSLGKTFFDIPFTQSYDSSDLAYIFRLTGELKNSETISSQIVRIQTFDQDVSFENLRDETAPVAFNGIKVYHSITGEFVHYEIYRDGVSIQAGTDFQSKPIENIKGFGYENFNMPVGDCGLITYSNCARVCYYYLSGAAKNYFACSSWECTSTTINPCAGGGGGGSGSPSYGTVDKANFKYPPGSNYETLYPKLTEYIKNKIPLLKTNYAITSAIMNITGLTLSQIQNDLDWGNGPTIEVKQLGEINGSEIYGQFGATHPNKLFIDVDLVNDMENSVPGTMEADGLAFLMGVSILHEYVHYGDNVDGNDYPDEEGVIFEQAVYGQTVWRHNAKSILKGN